MARVICPHCSVEVPGDDVNVTEGVAYCRSCSNISRLADIVDDDIEFDGDVTGTPPNGCRVLDDGVETRVVASARSIGRAIGTFAVAAFWNGIVSIFVLIAIAGTLQHLFGSVPSWFPAPGSGSGNGMGMSLGMVIFFWIFLTPFIVVGTVMIGAFLTSLFGRCEVRVRGHEGSVFTGFGPIGWRRKFDASAVKSVASGRTTWSQNDERQPCIVITAGKKLRIGSLLPADRRAWMTIALRRRLVL